MRVRSLAGADIGNVFHMDYADAKRAIASGTCEEVTSPELEPALDTRNVTPGAVAAPFSAVARESAVKEVTPKRGKNRQRGKR